MDIGWVSLIPVMTVIILALTGAYYVLRGITDLKTYSEWVVKGMSNYLRVNMILALAFAFSSLVGELGTGTFIASISRDISPAFIPAMVFIIGAVMSNIFQDNGKQAIWQATC
ncbi:Na+/H+ antiporter family protein [Peptoclostridium litorale DSM 5388]|uniref:Na+/H+ antiporter NhaC-like C-terminal domain-containing protein n=1 Tax=Peptoclostridium litorale DSM 5388 TaxID=1121324 RepID=A0A069RF38_PEPLI|nr:Na+/H+ antiporter NhaC family protein [Peptoclostridium litorale]KDR95413.1 hypothetical protein CLIT_10c01400 [Peptoclostridium litorale DSM 5388]SIO19261.1 Na+/H+ antiporter family protein [Peptoclostridium litorale DSM 5388]